MDRDFRRGYLLIDFPTEPFDSVGRVLLRSTRLFFSTLPFLATVTLLVMVPGKLLVQSLEFLLDVPQEGILSCFLMDLTDLALGALVAPAAIYGLIEVLRSGRPAPAGECLRWGARMWSRSLWNQFKVEITVALWSLLLVVPGLVAMLRLTFTQTVVAIEADRVTEVLARSRQLSAGRLWRILAALLPAVPIGAIHMYAGMRALQYSRWLEAPVDAVLAVADQWMTAAVLLMYLGLTQAAVELKGAQPEGLQPDRHGFERNRRGDGAPGGRSGRARADRRR